MQRASEFLRTSRYPFLWLFGGVAGTVGVANLVSTHFLENDPNKAFFTTQNRYLSQQRAHYENLTKTELIMKAIGAGEDWMTKLPKEQRVKFWLWPWTDWFMFNMMPYRQMGYDFTDDVEAVSNQSLYKMEHCPDCYRFTLYTSLTLLLLSRSGRTTAFRTIMIFIVFFSSLIGLIKGESGCWDWIILGSALPHMAVGDPRDINFAVYNIASRRRFLGTEKKIFDHTYAGDQTLLKEIQEIERRLADRVIPMSQVDEYVRNMSAELRKTLNVGEWEYGRPYPEEELLAHIYRSGGKNPKQSERNSKIEINKKTEEMDDIELFMTQLSQQLEDENKKITKNES